MTAPLEPECRGLRASVRAARTAALFDYTGARITNANRCKHAAAKRSWQWIKRNTGPLSVVMALINALVLGVWTLYTHYRPPRQAQEIRIVALYDRDRHRQGGEPPVPGSTEKPNSEPLLRQPPQIRVIVDSVPLMQAAAPQIQRTLVGASVALQNGWSFEDVNPLVLDYLASMGLVDRNIHKYIAWTDWNTIEVSDRPFIGGMVRV